MGGKSSYDRRTTDCIVCWCFTKNRTYLVLTYIKRTPKASKADIKAQFLYFFKTPDAKHLVAKKLKTTSQKPTQFVQEYDKQRKDLLSQLDYLINEQLLIQWFLVGLSQKIRRNISLETFKTYEDALTKALQVEMDEDFPTYPMDTRLEEQLEIIERAERQESRSLVHNMLYDRTH